MAPCAARRDRASYVPDITPQVFISCRRVVEHVQHCLEPLPLAGPLLRLVSVHHLHLPASGHNPGHILSELRRIGPRRSYAWCSGSNAFLALQTRNQQPNENWESNWEALSATPPTTRRRPTRSLYSRTYGGACSTQAALTAQRALGHAATWEAYQALVGLVVRALSAAKLRHPRGIRIEQRGLKRGCAEGLHVEVLLEDLVGALCPAAVTVHGTSG